MVSVSHINASQMTPGQMGVTGTPETAEFDFLSYLLGLQVSPTSVEGELDTEALLAASLPMNAPTEETLLPAETREKETSQWNPIFPGLTATMPTEMSKVEISGVRLADAMAQKAVTSLPERQVQMAGRALQVTPEGNNELAAMGQKGSEAVNSLQPEPQPAPAAQVVRKYAAAVDRSAGSPETGPVESDRPVQSKARIENPEILEKARDSKAKRDDVAGLGEKATPFSLHAAGGPVANTLVQPHATQTQHSTVPQFIKGVEGMIHQGGGKMTVRLSPPDLGEVQVEVTTRGNRVEIEMRSESEVTKTVLESRLSDLKNSIQAQDLVLSKMEVHVGRETTSLRDEAMASFSQGSNAFHQPFQQGQTDQGNSARQDRGFESRTAAQHESSVRPMTTARTAASVGSGRVDMRI